MEWRDPSGDELLSGGSVTVGAPVTRGSTTTLTITFNPLHTSHGGEYTCQGTLNSTEMEYALVSQDVTVQSEFNLNFITLEYSD